MIGSDTLLCADCDHSVIISGPRTSALSGNSPLCRMATTEAPRPHPQVLLCSHHQDSWHLVHAKSATIQYKKTPPGSINWSQQGTRFVQTGALWVSSPGLVSKPWEGEDSLQTVAAHVPISETAAPKLKKINIPVSLLDKCQRTKSPLG